MKTLSRKKTILDELLGKFDSNEFNSDDIKIISKEHGFRNHFDVPKHNSTDSLSSKMLEEDVFLLRSGDGNYKFHKSIRNSFHELEKINDDDCIDMKYEEDPIIDEITSEGDLLKYIEITHILDDFLRATIESRGSGRRQVKELSYNINGEVIETSNVQIEIDDVFYAKKENILFTAEAKINFLKDFNIFQLFFPVYYYKIIKKKNMDVKSIFAQGKISKKSLTIELYLYEFKDPSDITSITFIKNKRYILHF